MSELFEHIDKLKSAEPRVAVATLVNTRGTTPRKEGAKMVVGEGGRILGSVTRVSRVANVKVSTRPKAFCSA